VPNFAGESLKNVSAWGKDAAISEVHPSLGHARREAFPVLKAATGFSRAADVGAGERLVFGLLDLLTQSEKFLA